MLRVLTVPRSPGLVDGLLDRLGSEMTIPAGTSLTRVPIGGAATARGMCGRLGVVGAHGGAGASTLAAALALVGHGQGHAVALVDADQIGEGIQHRLGRSMLPTRRGLRLVSATDVAVAGMSPRLLDHLDADLAVVDLGRGMELWQQQMAAGCDLVFVVADAVRNERATRHVLTELSGTGVVMALVARRMIDHTADLIAGDFTITMAGDLHVEERCFNPDGAICLPRAGTLLAAATDLLTRVPELIDEVGGR